MVGLVVGDNGGGSVVQADKSKVNSASSIGLNGDINGRLLNEGAALFSDDVDAVDVLGDNPDSASACQVCTWAWACCCAAVEASHCALT